MDGASVVKIDFQPPSLIETVAVAGFLAEAGGVAADAGSYDGVAHCTAVAADVAADYGEEYMADKDVLVVRLHMRVGSGCEEPEVVDIVDVDWVHHAHQIVPEVAEVEEVLKADFQHSSARRNLWDGFLNVDLVPCSCGRNPEHFSLNGRRRGRLAALTSFD